MGAVKPKVAGKLLRRRSGSRDGEKGATSATNMLPLCESTEANGPRFRLLAGALLAIVSDLLFVLFSARSTLVAAQVWLLRVASIVLAIYRLWFVVREYHDFVAGGAVTSPIGVLVFAASTMLGDWGVRPLPAINGVTIMLARWFTLAALPKWLSRKGHPHLLDLACVLGFGLWMEYEWSLCGGTPIWGYTAHKAVQDVFVTGRCALLLLTAIMMVVSCSCHFWQTVGVPIAFCLLLELLSWWGLGESLIPALWQGDWAAVQACLNPVAALVASSCAEDEGFVSSSGGDGSSTGSSSSGGENELFTTLTLAASQALSQLSTIAQQLVPSSELLDAPLTLCSDLNDVVKSRLGPLYTGAVQSALSTAAFMQFSYASACPARHVLWRPYAHSPGNLSQTSQQQRRGGGGGVRDSFSGSGGGGGVCDIVTSPAFLHAADAMDGYLCSRFVTEMVGGLPPHLHNHDAQMSGSVSSGSGSTTGASSGESPSSSKLTRGDSGGGQEMSVGIPLACSDFIRAATSSTESSSRSSSGGEGTSKSPSRYSSSSHTSTSTSSSSSTGQWGRHGSPTSILASFLLVTAAAAAGAPQSTPPPHLEVHTPFTHTPPFSQSATAAQLNSQAALLESALANLASLASRGAGGGGLPPSNPIDPSVVYDITRLELVRILRQMPGMGEAVAHEADVPDDPRVPKRRKGAGYDAVVDMSAADLSRNMHAILDSLQHKADSQGGSGSPPLTTDPDVDLSDLGAFPPRVREQVEGEGGDKMGFQPFCAPEQEILQSLELYTQYLEAAKVMDTQSAVQAGTFAASLKDELRSRSSVVTPGDASLHQLAAALGYWDALSRTSADPAVSGGIDGVGLDDFELPGGAVESHPKAKSGGKHEKGGKGQRRASSSSGGGGEGALNSAAGTSSSAITGGGGGSNKPVGNDVVVRESSWDTFTSTLTSTLSWVTLRGGEHSASTHLIAVLCELGAALLLLVLFVHCFVHPLYPLMWAGTRLAKSTASSSSSTGSGSHGTGGSGSGTGSAVAPSATSALLFRMPSVHDANAAAARAALDALRKHHAASGNLGLQYDGEGYQTHTHGLTSTGEKGQRQADAGGGGLGSSGSNGGHHKGAAKGGKKGKAGGGGGGGKKAARSASGSQLTEGQVDTEDALLDALAASEPHNKEFLLAGGSKSRRRTKTPHTHTGTQQQQLQQLATAHTNGTGADTNHRGPTASGDSGDVGALLVGESGSNEGEPEEQHHTLLSHTMGGGVDATAGAATATGTLSVTASSAAAVEEEEDDEDTALMNAAVLLRYKPKGLASYMQTRHPHTSTDAAGSAAAVTQQLESQLARDRASTDASASSQQQQQLTPSSATHTPPLEGFHGQQGESGEGGGEDFTASKPRHKRGGRRKAESGSTEELHTAPIATATTAATAASAAASAHAGGGAVVDVHGHHLPHAASTALHTSHDVGTGKVVGRANSAFPVAPFAYRHAPSGAHTTTAGGGGGGGGAIAPAPVAATTATGVKYSGGGAAHPTVPPGLSGVAVHVRTRSGNLPPTGGSGSGTTSEPRLFPPPTRPALELPELDGTTSGVGVVASGGVEVPNSTGTDRSSPGHRMRPFTPMERGATATASLDSARLSVGGEAIPGYRHTYPQHTHSHSQQVQVQQQQVQVQQPFRPATLTGISPAYSSPEGMALHHHHTNTNNTGNRINDDDGDVGGVPVLQAELAHTLVGLDMHSLQPGSGGGGSVGLEPWQGTLLGVAGTPIAASYMHPSGHTHTGSGSEMHHQQSHSGLSMPGSPSPWSPPGLQQQHQVNVSGGVSDGAGGGARREALMSYYMALLRERRFTEITHQLDISARMGDRPSLIALTLIAQGVEVPSALGYTGLLPPSMSASIPREGPGERALRMTALAETDAGLIPTLNANAAVFVPNTGAATRTPDAAGTAASHTPGTSGGFGGSGGGSGVVRFPSRGVPDSVGSRLGGLSVGAYDTLSSPGHSPAFLDTVSFTGHSPQTHTSSHQLTNMQLLSGTSMTPASTHSFTSPGNDSTSTSLDSGMASGGGGGVGGIMSGSHIFGAPLSTSSGASLFPPTWRDEGGGSGSGTHTMNSVVGGISGLSPGTTRMPHGHVHASGNSVPSLHSATPPPPTSGGFMTSLGLPLFLSSTSAPQAPGTTTTSTTGSVLGDFSGSGHPFPLRSHSRNYSYGETILIPASDETRHLLFSPDTSSSHRSSGAFQME